MLQRDKVRFCDVFDDKCGVMVTFTILWNPIDFV